MTKNKPKMNLWGIGPVFVSIAVVIFALGVYVSFECGLFFLSCFSNIYINYFIGTMCAIFGFVMWLVEAVQLHKTIAKQELKTTGFYAIVRNPVYAGFYFMLLGLGFILNSWFIVLVCMPAIYLVLRFLLFKEERLLTEIFGNEYVQYKKKVNAVFPTLKGLKIKFY